MSSTGSRIPSNAAPPRSLQRSRGFTLFELMLAGAVAVLLAAIAVPSYRAVVERQKVTQAVRDLSMLAQRIEKFRSRNGLRPPMSLDELGVELPKDPWGRDYRFLNFDDDIPGINGRIRKDHNLHPLNSEFDLYSLGPDGESRSPLTASQSRDDIVWGRDGAFIGVAENF